MNPTEHAEVLRIAQQAAEDARARGFTATAGDRSEDHEHVIVSVSNGLRSSGVSNFALRNMIRAGYVDGLADYLIEGL